MEREKKEGKELQTVSALEKLNERILLTNSHLCVGLDIHPSSDKVNSSTVSLNNSQIVEETINYACAFKFQLAGYLSQGSSGIAELEKSILYIKDKHPTVPIILDGKFNDIDATLSEYAYFAFEHLGVDAVTANPYLGKEANSPLLSYKNKLIYFLCVTSNPGANEFQGHQDLYTKIADNISNNWNTNNNCGLVVGATKSDELLRVRVAAPKLPFLMPGLGVQGADPKVFIPRALTNELNSVVINVSRGISESGDYKAAAKHFHREIENAISEESVSDKTIKILSKVGALNFGDFILQSGEHSNVYIDVRRLTSNPRELMKIAEYLVESIKGDYDFITAIPTGGVPLAVAISILTNKPLVYIRSEAKSYGTKKMMEGLSSEEVRNKTSILVDDVITGGESKKIALNVLESAGVTVNNIAVVVDRREVQETPFMGRQITSLTTLNKITLANSRLTPE